MRVTCEATDPTWRLRLEPGPGGQVALDSAGVAALADALEQCAAAPGCRALVITSEGPIFCAGMDLQEAVLAPPEVRQGTLRGYARALQRLLTLPAVSLAVVEGAASGGGVGLACACDLVVAGPQTSFQLPELRFGLVPAVILAALRKRLTTQQIRRLALTGESLPAAEARAWGLVDAVASDPAGEADRLVRGVLRARPAAVRTLQRLLAELDAMPDVAALQVGVAQTAGDLADPEVEPALREFLADGAAMPWWTRPGGQE